jgi:aminoglycoside 6'-N-acetyltransferase I
MAAQQLSERPMTRYGVRMTIRIEKAGPECAEAWVAMREALWPTPGGDAHGEEVALLVKTDRAAGFVAFDTANSPIGFAEVTLRDDYVNGCETTPVAFLEGLYVIESARRRGVGRGLIDAVEAWARSRGCAELASDAAIGNQPSHALHEAVGFAETERVVFFRKEIGRRSSGH